MRETVGILFAAWVLMAALPVEAQETAPVERLKGALEETWRSNPDLEAARARLRAVAERVPQALAGFRPRLFASGNVDATTGRSRSETGVETDLDNAGAGAALSVRQNLYAGGGTTAAVRAAEATLEAERLRLVDTTQNVFLAAIEAYVAVWRDRHVLRLALRNRDRLVRHLEATRDRFRVGEVTRTDVAQAEARLEQAKAEVERARADVVASEARFLRTVGRPPAEVLADPAEPEDLPTELDDALARTDGHPLIRAAAADLRAAEAGIDVAFAALLPSLDAEATLAYADDPSSLVDWQRSASVRLSVTVPLFQGGGEYARVREARRNLEAARRALDSVRREVRRRAHTAWERLRAARAAMRAFEAQVAANRVALEGVQQEAMVGARTVLDVLDAEQELFQSEVNLVRARGDRILAGYELLAALGELVPERLGLAGTVSDPADYARRARGRLFGLD